MDTFLRTRIKCCGLTRTEDVRAAVAAGADALGFVFYDKSPRHVRPGAASALLDSVPSFVTTVGLFVNESPNVVAAVLRDAPVSLLQFHGDETPEACAEIAERTGRPFLKAVRVKPNANPGDLVELEQQCRTLSKLFRGLLLDAFVDGYGGGGKVFDWSLIPDELGSRVVLSGGLNAQNVADAVARIRPCAVDVSSGIEQSKGIKDAAKIHAFVQAVHQADRSLRDSDDTLNSRTFP